MEEKPEMLTYALELIEHSQLPAEQIAARAQLSPSWVSKLRQGRVPNPGVLTLQRLIDALEPPPPV